MSDSDGHNSGCFPCRWSTGRRTKKSGHSEPQVAATRQAEPYHDSGKEKEQLPTATDYAIEATKKTIEILRGVAALVPFPLVKEIMDLGLNIISTCEAVNNVRDKVTGLTNRIATFLLVIAKVSKTPSEEESADKFSQKLTEDLTELKLCLASITQRLTAINEQNALLTGLLAQPNIQVINDCEVEFQGSVDRFQTLRAICAAQDLATIQQQLVTLYGVTKEMADDVKVTREKVEDIESSVNELKSMLSKDTTQSSNKALAKMPRAPGVFFGRDDVVQRIAKQLSSRDPSHSHLCILGPGGMGKTSAALAIMEHSLVKQTFAEQNQFWVPCIGANSPTLLLSILSKYTRARKEADDLLVDVISSLQQTDEPRIILLDNFETPWHPVEGSQGSVKQVLEALDALPHVAILVTMRSEFSPLDHWHSERLLQVKPEDSKKIYTAIDASGEAYPELDDLLNAIGHLPYAITLMASRGKRSFASPKQLLEEWNELGVSMLSKDKQGIHHSISLSIDSKFVTESPGTVRLLQILSMLPNGIYYSDLDIWAKGWRSEAVDTLRDAALVLAREVVTTGERKIHLFVLPVVQSYMKHRHKIPNDVKVAVYTACYEFLVERNATIKGPNDPRLRQHLVVIASQESNIQALLTEMIGDALAEDEASGPTAATNPSSNISSQLVITRRQRLEGLLAYIWYQYWTRPRPELSQRVAAVAKKYGYADYEGQVLFCLGQHQWRLDINAVAQQTFEEAKVLFESLGDDLRTLRSELMAISSLNWSQGDSDTALERLNQIRPHWEDRLSRDPVLRAYFMSEEGVYHWRSHRSSVALSLLEEGRELFKAAKEPYQAQNCSFWISRCEAELENWAAAIEAADAAIQWDKELFGDQSDGIVFHETILNYIQKARYLKGANQWGEEPEDLLRYVLEAAQELGLSRSTIYTLIELAEIYVRKQDWEAARLAYEEIIRRSSGLEDEALREIARDAKHNLSCLDEVGRHLNQDDIEWVLPGRT